MNTTTQLQDEDRQKRLRSKIEQSGMISIDELRGWGRESHLAGSNFTMVLNALLESGVIAQDGENISLAEN